MNFDIEYIVDENGNKTAVIIPIKAFKDMIEELEDLRDIEERRDEELIDHEQVKKVVLGNEKI